AVAGHLGKYRRRVVAAALVADVAALSVPLIEQPEEDILALGILREPMQRARHMLGRQASVAPLQAYWAAGRRIVAFDSLEDPDAAVGLRLLCRQAEVQGGP